MKNSKGITLVAMVITIIVMLILAGVSISMVVGDNGVLTRGQKAASDTQLSSAKDAIGLSITSNQTDYFAKAAENTSISSQKPLYLSVANFNEYCEGYKLIGAASGATADTTYTFSNVQNLKITVKKGYFGINSVATASAGTSIAAGCSGVYSVASTATAEQKVSTSASSATSSSGYTTNVLFFSDGGSATDANANNIYVAAVHFEKGFFKVDDIGIISGTSANTYTQGQVWNDTIKNDAAITWLNAKEVVK